MLLQDEKTHGKVAHSCDFVEIGKKNIKTNKLFANKK